MLRDVSSTIRERKCITVLNSKGGCGKSMLATNLAAFYAKSGYNTALVDFDPQGTSIHWLKLRGEEKKAIHGIDASQIPINVTRSFYMRMPPTIERVVIDTPAAVKGAELQEFIQQADNIILPVLPSKGDIHAVAHFIETLLLDIKIKTYNAKVCVVANRVRRNTKILKTLENFLTHIKFPFVSSFRETQNYIHAAQEGLGVCEMRPPSRFAKDLAQWQTLLDWLEEGPAIEIDNILSSSFSASKN